MYTVKEIQSISSHKFGDAAFLCPGARVVKNTVSEFLQADNALKDVW